MNKIEDFDTVNTSKCVCGRGGVTAPDGAGMLLYVYAHSNTHMLLNE